jgi:hypothetical protein
MTIEAEACHRLPSLRSVVTLSKHFSEMNGLVVKGIVVDGRIRRSNVVSRVSRTGKQYVKMKQPSLDPRMRLLLRKCQYFRMRDKAQLGDFLGEVAWRREN